MSLTSFPDRGLRTVVRLRGTAGTGGYGDPTIDWSNPDRKIIRSCDWQPEQGQEISLDRSHRPDPASAHTFQAEGTITISVRRLTRRGAAALKVRLRRIPRTT